MLGRNTGFRPQRSAASGAGRSTRKRAAPDAAPLRVGALTTGVTAVDGPEVIDAPDYPFCRALRPDPMEIRRTLIEMRSQFADPCGEDMVGRLELVVAEILNNIAEHGLDVVSASRNAGADPGASSGQTPTRRAAYAPGAADRVHLSVAQAAGGLFCIVCDNGDAVPDICFTPSHRALPGAIEALPEGGFGWSLIHEITEKLYYRPDHGHNVLAFLVPKAGPPAAA